MRATILVVVLLVSGAFAGTGDLDPTFGTGGITVTNPGFGIPGQGLVRQSTGKLVSAGSSGALGLTADDFMLLRYDADGEPDPTFGAGGVATADFSPIYATVTGAAVQPDDAIVVVGVGSSVP